MKSTAVRLWADEFVVEAQQHVQDRPFAPRLVHDVTTPFGTGDTKELHIGAREVVNRSLAEHEYPSHRRNRIVHRDDHLGRGQPFGRRTVVGGKGLRINRRGQILILEATDTQADEAGRVHRTTIGMRVAIAPFLVQDAFVLATR